jgi:hypothetical protein
MKQEEQPAPKRRGGRPATGRDPVRSVRIGALWDRCVELATGRGESMTTFVERALTAEEKRLLRAAERSADTFRNPDIPKEVIASYHREGEARVICPRCLTLQSLIGGLYWPHPADTSKGSAECSASRLTPAEAVGRD